LSCWGVNATIWAMSSAVLLFCFWDRVSLTLPGCPQTCNPFLPPPKCWDYCMHHTTSPKEFLFLAGT
jgi:hypothetical protein